ncbi:nucleoporin subcomplex protein binding to Pom34-domain-containing protein [Phlyctochytrium arcticum]|nr:nucleoporin subcomplex protein binding to Pom34-domain-containing protein [Phlyctochytrium arcticum]
MTVSTQTSVAIPSRPWTRKTLWQTIEHDKEQIYTAEEFATNLAPHRQALEEGLDWYKPQNEQSRKKLETRGEKPKVAFIKKVSALINLDELQCEGILENCIKDDLEAPASKRRIDWSNMKQINYDDEALVTALQLHYLNEREETLFALAALIRASDDEGHRYSHLVRAMVESMFTSEEPATDWAERLYKQLNSAIHRKLPKEVANHPEWATTWAKQYVKEQGLLLQITFLVFYSVLPCPPELASKFVTLIIEDFNFGKEQVNAAHFNKETIGMLKGLEDLCVLLTLEVLRLNEFMDADDAVEALQVHSSVDLLAISQVIERRGKSQRSPLDPLGPVMLAWGVLLSTLCPELEKSPDSASVHFLDWITAESTNSMRNPHMLIQVAYVQYQAVPFLLNALQGTLSADENVALGYKSVIKDVLLLLLQVVQDPLILPQRNIFLQCLTVVFENEGQLAIEWWEHDYEIPERRLLLDAARNVFPLDTSQLVRFLTSLTSCSRSSTYVFRYMKELNTLADYLRSEDYSEDPFAPAGDVFTWRGNDKSLVMSAQNFPFIIPNGTTAQQINLEPPIALVAYHYSGWKMCLSLLDSFVHGSGNPESLTAVHIHGSPEAATHVLTLFQKIFEHADDALILDILEHLKEVYPNNTYWKDNISESFVGLVCQVLNRACTLTVPNIELLTISMSCLSSLLKYFPDAVWKHLRAEVLFPRHSISPWNNSFPANSYMEEAVLPIEVASGRYSTIISFLDFVSALIHDAQSQRIVDERSSQLETTMETQFWSAKRDPKLMDAFDSQMGGPESRKVLEDRLRKKQKLKEASVLKSEMLFSAIAYIHSEILPKHTSWRYVRIHDKYKIGLQILQIFNQIMSDSTWLSEKNSSRTAQMVDFGAVQNYLMQSYLVDGSVYQIMPLVGFVSIGNDVPMQFHRESKTKTARLVEECIENALLFIKSLLKLRKIKNVGVSLLERALLDRTIEHREQRCGVELVQVLGRYITYENYRSLPLLAIEVLSLLCAVAADWQPRPPSFAGYFGLDAYAFTKSLTKLLERNKNSPLIFEELQTALYNFVTLVVATQPGLGAILMTGESSRPVFPISRDDKRDSLEVLTGSDDSSSVSVLTPIMDLLTSWKQALGLQPTTLPAAMRLLDALWQNAPQYISILDKVRSNNQFWACVCDIFADNTATPTEEEMQRMSLIERGHAVRRIAYGQQVRTYALRILAFELHFTQATRINPGTLKAVKQVLHGGNDGKGIPMFTDNSRMPYKPELVATALELSAELPIVIDLSTYRTQSWSDDFDVDLQFGNSYIYDLDLLENKVLGKNETRPVSMEDSNQETIDEFLAAVSDVNLNRSLTDAHISLVKAWKKFLIVLTTREHLSSKVSKGSKASELCISSSDINGLIRRLTDILTEEHSEEALNIAYRAEISDLLLFLVSAWAEIDATKGDKNLLSAAGVLSRLLASMCTEHFELGPPGYFSQHIFHKHILTAIAISLKVLRKQADLSVTEQSEVFRALQDLLPVMCKGLSLVLRGLDANFKNVIRNKETRTLVVCFTELVKLNDKSHAATTIAIIERHGLFPLLIATFQKSLSIPLEEQPIFADDLMGMFLALSEMPLGADRLAEEGTLISFTSNSFTPFLMESDDPPESWHHIWCQMLSVVTTICQNVTKKSLVLQEAAGFVKIYQQQIFSNLWKAVRAELDFVRLSETLRITQLFFVLAASSDCPSVSESSYEYLSGTLSGYETLALEILAHFVYLFDHPQEMLSLIHTSSFDNEKSRIQASSSKGGSSGTSRNQSEQNGNASSDETESSSADTLAYRKICHMVFLIIRNILVHMRKVTNTDGFIAGGRGSGQVSNSVFRATMASMAGEVATIGMLFDALKQATTIWQARLEFLQKEQIEGYKRPVALLAQSDPSVPILDEAAFVIESALALVTTQIALCKKSIEDKDQLKELISELDPAFAQVDAMMNSEENAARFGEKFQSFFRVLLDFRINIFSMRSQ